MGVYNKVLSVGVVAASANNISLSQSLAAPGNLLINGAAASGGSVTFTYATQLKFTFAGDETGHNFIVTGTGTNGQVITETVAGNNTNQTTVNYFLTVTKISGPTTTSTLTVGTTAVGISQVYVVDKFINPAVISVSAAVTGTINYSIQVAADDLSPSWDLVTSPPTWQSPGSGFASQAANLFSSIQGPITLMRVLQNSGTGSVVVTVNTPMGNIA